MNADGCFSSPLGTSVNVAQQQLASGQALGMFGPSSYFSILQQMAGKSTLVAAAFPGTNDPSQTELAVGLGSGFSINAKTKHPAQAEQFLDFLMQPANSDAYAVDTSQVPAIPNSAYQPPDQASKLAEQYIADNKTAPIGNQLYPNPKVVPAWQQANQQMLGGSATPLDVAQAMDQAWDSQ
jgi:raffinose/stachyose/melibiose transport system substrate-binding protein